MKRWVICFILILQFFTSPAPHTTRFTSKYHTTIKQEHKEDEKEENTEKRHTGEAEEDTEERQEEDTEERRAEETEEDAEEHHTEEEREKRGKGTSCRGHRRGYGGISRGGTPRGEMLLFRYILLFYPRHYLLHNLRHDLHNTFKIMASKLETTSKKLSQEINLQTAIRSNGCWRWYGEMPRARSWILSFLLALQSIPIETVIIWQY